MEWLLASLVAGIFTYCDLAAVFDAPPHTLQRRPWLILLAWWWGFIVANALLAGLLFALLREQYFKDVNPWLAALGAGAGYSSLVRLQFTTLQIHGKATPVGIETFYEMLKGLVHQRINRIIREWRMEQSAALTALDLADLRQRALLMVGSDSLKSQEVRNADATWINQTTSNAKVPEADRRRIIALFIITGQRTS